MNPITQHNAAVLKNEINWLTDMITARLKTHLGKDQEGQDVTEPAPPAFENEEATYVTFVNHYNLTVAERLVLILSLAPHIKPEVLDPLFTKNNAYDRGHTEFGGCIVGNHSGILPTGETALFLLAATDLDTRFHLQYMFDAGHLFAKGNILKLETTHKNDPLLSGVLQLSLEYIDHFTQGYLRKPDFGPGFPAKHITTGLVWEDAILRPDTREQIMEIKDWITYGPKLLNGWGLGHRIKPGYKALFYGPSGTGKTLTASLLGKYTQRDVYKIDLSMVVSKYIGETEKNLAGVFDKAEKWNWILFFDEADALFGKRTETVTAHDRHANQEVAYLLQRIEDYSGLVILATNLKDNIDSAFMRRFQTTAYFSPPGPEERLQLWKNAISGEGKLDEAIDLSTLAKKYKLTGALIMNAIQYASMQTIKKDSKVVAFGDLEAGIKRELVKEGISLM